ncbi:MAG: imelysin family protein [Chitinophagales bacterium]
MTAITSCAAGPDNIANRKMVVTGYADLVDRKYSESLVEATKLQSAVNNFCEIPDSAKMEAAKKQWIEARKSYAQTEVFRFYDGPIDNGTTGVESLLNAWPLDEVYVDYVEGDQRSGIINNLKDYPEIKKELLIGLNEKGGEENIATGFHAVEFLLWGQDLNNAGPGARPVNDYIDENRNASRRKIYLQLTTDLIVENLKYLTQQWQPDKKDNYRYSFENANANISLQKIITGIAILSKVEMAGERMFTAYDNANQEDEQSCFSDNTKADLVDDLQGILKVFYGNSYLKNSSSNGLVTIVVGENSLAGLLRSTDSELFNETVTLLNKCITNLDNIYQPFDQALILEKEREKLYTAILSMQDLGDQFSRVAEKLGLTINVNAVS